jgi:ADP-dependent NAD(P)H-hydrate dehydratase / NAD(P)H-hydrate epimerase
MTPPHTEVCGRARVPLFTAAGAAAADRAAQEQYGVPQRVLMENAGRGAALVLQRLYPRGRVLGVAGSGNNGGDLLVMLRTLQSWGREVILVVAGTTPPAGELGHGTAVRVVDDAAAALADAAVIVDGMLGTGSAGAPRGAVADWAQRISASDRPVMALDLPTGVDASTGAVPGLAVRADTTVTFGWPKLGLLLQPARQYCGRIIAIDIAFPPQVDEGADAWAITPQHAFDLLPSRAPDAHKGSAGRLLVLAGSEGMAGAAALTAGAALRAGAGLVRIASCSSNRVALQTLVPEATFLDRAALGDEPPPQLNAAVIGPGLGQSDASRRALQDGLAYTDDCPLLLDADALNILAGDTDELRRIAASRATVITPHPLELSRLTGRSLDEIVADTPAAARSAARDFGCVVLLKGQPTLVAEPDGTLHVNVVGSSDLATGGMGDQLAGVIGAFMAAGAAPLEAACAGLYFSGRAAEICVLGRSLSPRDVTAALPQALRPPVPMHSTLDLPFITFDQPARW